MRDPQTGELVTFTQTVSNTQQVVLEEQLVAAVGTWGHQGSDKQPGLKNAGFLSTMVSVSGNPTTPYIYEPIFYYVLPCGTVYNNDPLTWPNSHGGVTGDPEVTTFQADDGRQVARNRDGEQRLDHVAALDRCAVVVLRRQRPLQVHLRLARAIGIVTRARKPPTTFCSTPRARSPR